MPTLPEREKLRDCAIESFTRQMACPSCDWTISLSTEANPKPSLGAKLNSMIRRSDADIFVLLDDDDWHHPLRLLSQVAPIVNGIADVTGTSKIYYYDLDKGCAWLYQGSGDWIGGLAFRREVWERCSFDDLSAGVDYRWQQKNKSKSKILDLAQPWLFVAGIHRGNTCPKATSNSCWSRVPSEQLPQEFLQSRLVA
jgi:hypothetical protein